MISPFSVSAADNLNYFRFLLFVRLKESFSFFLFTPVLADSYMNQKSAYLVRRAHGVNDNQFALSACDENKILRLASPHQPTKSRNLSHLV